MPSEDGRLVRFGPQVSGEAPIDRFGFKTHGLARMASLGLPVPPGFALSVDVCREYYSNGRILPSYLSDYLHAGTRYLETATGYGFGDPRRPLLVSVRSGSPVSMPGMMATILNVGLTRETLSGLIVRWGDPRFAWDSYRRLLENLGEVMGVDPALRDEALRSTLSAAGAREPSEMDFRALRDLSSAYERVLRRARGEPFPEEPRDQLLRAVRAVLDSWMSPRAQRFRERNRLDSSGGTAVTVQAMVFGNLGRDSGAGVFFTRNPWNGEPRPLIDFRLSVQGEDVVSRSRRAGRDDFERLFPELHQGLLRYGRRLEAEFHDMQDVEFTVEAKRLYLLQTRAAAREPLAALRVALDLEAEGRIGPAEARSRLASLDLGKIVVHEAPPDVDLLARGEPASIGVAVGMVAFSPQEVEELARRGPVILVRDDLTADDLGALDSAVGALMPRGSRTSHAIVVARQMQKAVVVNCPSVEVDPVARRLRVGDREVRAGETISLDGATGSVYAGKVDFRPKRPEELLGRARLIGLALA